jgi:hypothetical protein
VNALFLQEDLLDSHYLYFRDHGVVLTSSTVLPEQLFFELENYIDDGTPPDDFLAGTGAFTIKGPITIERRDYVTRETETRRAAVAMITHLATRRLSEVYLVLNISALQLRSRMRTDLYPEFGAAIVDENGAVISATGDGTPEPGTVTDYLGPDGGSFISRTDGRRFLNTSVPSSVVDWNYLSYTDYGELVRPVRTFILIAGLALAVILAGGIVLSALMRNRIVRPIHSIREALAASIGGEVPGHGPEDELSSAEYLATLVADEHTALEDRLSMQKPFVTEIMVARLLRGTLDDGEPESATGALSELFTPAHLMQIVCVELQPRYQSWLRLTPRERHVARVEVRSHLQDALADALLARAWSRSGTSFLGRRTRRRAPRVISERR